MNLDLKNCLGLTNPFFISKQFVKSNINFFKECDVKNINTILRYTDMKKGMNNAYNEFKNHKLCVRRSTLKFAEFFNVTCF